VYKVTKPDPDIIARTTDEIPQPGDIEFAYTSEKVAEHKYDVLQRFLNNRHASTSKKLERIHAFIDWLIEDLGVQNESVCQRGCAHCCVVDVDVGLIEAAYIADKTGLTLLDRKTRAKKGYHLDNHYCPFLDQSKGECTIYEFRPIVCRSFYAFDSPDYCREFAKHAIYSFQANGAIEHFATELIRQGGNRGADIREWFGEHQL